MRCLIVRFKDCEGPGTLLEAIESRNYKITYLNAYDHRVHLMPGAHQMFDLVVLLGGPQTVHDPAQGKFFRPWLDLASNLISMKDKKVIGICLGSQILASAFGAKVYVGEKGPEVGFSDVKIENSSHPAFKKLPGKTSFPAFHLHEDVFELPKGANRLLQGSFYPNQMFEFENRIFGIQCHLEVTEAMLSTWKKVHVEFIQKAGWIPGPETEDLRSQMEDAGKALFEGILDL
ncbi:type 1 glutamine amidotransferase [Leptospira langatensis]|uniref:Type 1 glutamine amidotransferase n=1 Tax=Leptospira langatensis TaxID=2484983 RepID=A0A5F1ZPR0_9LEPT|nr:type 1 glutamine amidotransferase [Leptospira langatensis]TGK05515.1 type 1 glutamine amidotransferase [Leptospira langatensis]TGL38651.1 type 1 glutamine amidotransferase [Leptospira langatensis]